MRTRTWCVAAALVCLPRFAAAQTVLSEADALARLSAESPRVRAIRAGDRDHPRGRARGRPVAESAVHVQPRVGGRRHREHVPGDAAAADNGTARPGGERGVRAGRRRASGGPTRRSVRFARRCAARTRTSCPRRCARPRSPPRATGCAAWRASWRGAKPPARPPATTAFAPSAKPWTSTRTGRRPEPIARVPRPGWPAFFRRPTDVDEPDRRRAAAVRHRAALPASRNSSPTRRASFPNWRRCGRRSQSAEFATRAAERRPVPEPEIVAGTKSSNLAGGDIGERLQHSRHRPAVRPREARAGAGTSASRTGRSADRRPSKHRSARRSPRFARW